jgi:hypothetical protein
MDIEITKLEPFQLLGVTIHLARIISHESIAIWVLLLLVILNECLNFIFKPLSEVIEVIMSHQLFTGRSLIRV